MPDFYSVKLDVNQIKREIHFWNQQSSYINALHSDSIPNYIVGRKSIVGCRVHLQEEFFSKILCRYRTSLSLVVGYADGRLPWDRGDRLQLVEHRVGELSPRPHSRRRNRRRLVPRGRRERRQLAIGCINTIEAVEPIDLVVGVPAASTGTA